MFYSCIRNLFINPSFVTVQPRVLFGFSSQFVSRALALRLRRFQRLAPARAHRGMLSVHVSRVRIHGHLRSSVNHRQIVVNRRANGFNSVLRRVASTHRAVPERTSLHG